MKESSKLVLSLIAVFLMASCASTTVMPISEYVPAAEIKVKSKDDKNGNTELEVKADHLASPERLKPAANIYVVWIESENGRTENIGMLEVDNGGKARLQAVTPYRPKAILITAEENGDSVYPTGTTIARSSL